VNLPPRPERKRNETRDITTPIRLALSKLPGVRLIRNVDRGLMVPYKLRLLPNAPKIMTGLGEGSSDLVGIVKIRVVLDDGPNRGRIVSIGRTFTLEIKRYALRGAHHDTRRNQDRWRRSVKLLGGFAGLIEARDGAHGIELAMAALARCRAGESE
jgi:hypothetical protein